MSYIMKVITFVVKNYNSDISHKCHKYENKDIFGFDIEWRYSKLDDCCRLCTIHPICQGWAWEAGEGGRCHLKSISGPYIDKPGVYAGSVPSN